MAIGDIGKDSAKMTRNDKSKLSKENAGGDSGPA